MGNPIRLGRIAGIPVQIDLSFLLALPLLAYLFAQQFVAAARLVGIPQERIGGDRYLWGLAVALALFASVLLHELAHSLYALRTGSRVSAITLLMIGFPPFRWTEGACCARCWSSAWPSGVRCALRPGMT